jgi:hypothetical protein
MKKVAEYSGKGSKGPAAPAGNPLIEAAGGDGRADPAYFALDAVRHQNRALHSQLAAMPDPIPTTPEREKAALKALTRWMS